MVSSYDREVTKQFFRNHTWELVPSTPNIHIGDNKWVFKIKTNPNGIVSRYKARLIAEGFQQTPSVDYF